jgi:light-regulated signal transduction histidine kinase (bacteriophytochrome)
MVALFNSMIEEIRQTFPDRKVDVKMKSLPAVYGDLALLKQVISNLLSNAVKFSGNRESSEIEIGSTQDENELTYYIKDNGTGFDMKFSHELFGVFRRLNNAEAYEGTGVGLALVKRIVDKHSGRVWAYSEPEKGATFYFALPANKIV